MAPEKPQWRELHTEVVTTGLCTGCAGCVVACPYDVLGYDESAGTYRPFHVDEHGGPDDCTYGQRGCTLCTRACPRFRTWEGEIDQFLFGRPRTEDEVYGIAEQVLFARAVDPELHAAGQDGGLVSAMLVHALEADLVDAALVSVTEDGGAGKAVPTVARTRAEVLAAAGSRYTYSANPLAYGAAIAEGAERLALVGMSCQASVPAVMAARRAGKVARRFTLTIGLLCSKTFHEDVFTELLDQRYGIAQGDIVRVNIKGAMQVSTRDGGYHEVPLKEARAWTRDGCKLCPDFAAEHADVSTGGIGAFPDWTLVIVRTARGRELLAGMVEAGAVEVRPIEDDPGALVLLERLSRVSRRRWPDSADPGPRRIPLQSS
ncbi:MAG: coenzyme F420-reducing hydrogenase, beta subunit [Acidimicrobiaceae bacterium]|nr:coenzyme F420-reducing hydrogenase, beta subunit [Acidimicrobiaceae bacterium]